MKLVELWGRAEELVKGKVVDEMWTCLLGLFTSGFSLVTCARSWEFTSFWGLRVLSLRSKSICLTRGER
jgi:hypothetical protein